MHSGEYSSYSRFRPPRWPFCLIVRGRISTSITSSVLDDSQGVGGDVSPDCFPRRVLLVPILVFALPLGYLSACERGDTTSTRQFAEEYQVGPEDIRAEHDSSIARDHKKDRVHTWRRRAIINPRFLRCVQYIAPSKRATMHKRIVRDARPPGIRHGSLDAHGPYNRLPLAWHRTTSCARRCLRLYVPSRP